MRNFAPQAGRLVIIGEEPLLECLLGTNGRPSLLLYGKPGWNCDVNARPTLTPTTPLAVLPASDSARHVPNLRSGPSPRQQPVLPCPAEVVMHRPEPSCDLSGKEVVLRPPHPLRTGRETFASSGSSRCKSPARAEPVARRSIPPCPFAIQAYSLRTRRTRLGQIIWPACLAASEDAHMDKAMFICFSSLRGSTGFLATHDRAGSRPACAAELKPQLLSIRLQDGVGFFQRSSARHPRNAPCGVACLQEAECRVYHVPREQR